MIGAPDDVVDAITAAALDYLDGYVRGDPNRHAGAYHPECVKRRLAPDENGITALVTSSPQMMVDYAASNPTVEGSVDAEVVIDAIDGDIASVRVYSTQWVDYLHVVHARGEWKLFHVTWKLRDE